MRSPMRVFRNLDELAAAEGQELGRSTVRTVDQSVITAFADVTGDRQWIHVDSERAETGPFGRTVAHGYYLLAVLSGMLAEIYSVDGAGLVINTGVDALRFHRPVPVGSRISATARLAKVRPRRRGVAEVTIEAGVFVEGRNEPTCTALVHSMIRPSMSRPGSPSPAAATGTV